MAIGRQTMAILQAVGGKDGENNNYYSGYDKNCHSLPENCHSSAIVAAKLWQHTYNRKEGQKTPHFLMLF